MYPSDFLYHKTTHDLLLTVLLSELGVYDVSSPHTIYVGVTMTFNDLRTALTSDLSEYVHSEVLNQDVLRADDMVLFYDLYTNINFFAACGADVDTIVDKAIMPSVTKMIAGDEEVRRFVEHACNDHASSHGDLVRHCMKRTLKQFNITSYIHIADPHKGIV